ncbi:hypothetical protein DFH27DRAFT_308762 [Peziza echinospora]|nr:hypothetical protein DFH27DRAFT_308762 [Peziza echinospora]
MLTSDSHRHIKRLHQRGITTHIHWVPGHCDIAGNDKADAAAKDGALNHPPHYSRYTSNAFLKRQAKADLQTRWAEEWNKLTRKQRGNSYWGGPPTLKPPPHLQLPKHITTTITQLRTAHGYFGSYLSNIPTSDFYNNPTCPCGAPVQSPKHLLLYCKRTHHIRNKILQQLDGPTPFTRVISNDGNVLVKLVTELHMGERTPEEEERDNTWGWGDDTGGGRKGQHLGMGRRER